MAKFATGDVVILVSGSMKMAVETTEGTDVNVVWADGGNVQRAVLPEAVLDKYIAPERSSHSRPDGPRGGGDRGGDRGGFRPGGGGGGFKPGGFKPGGGGGGFKPGGDRGGPRKDFGDKPRGGGGDRGGPRRDRD
jgi:uncharacterized protein YodC (DUF2158 family)